MMTFSNRQELLLALSETPKGRPRAELLADPLNRALIESTGANVTLYSGAIQNGATFKQQLRNISLGLIARLNAKTGQPDGIGALGGLSERTSVIEFDQMSLQQRLTTAHYRDDIIVKNNRIYLTNDLHIIRSKNISREVREELENIGIFDFKLNKKKIRLVEMPDVKDDNYVINIWSGSGDAWAINPYCHILKITNNRLDVLVEASENCKCHTTHSEVSRFIKLPLFEALKKYGNFSGKHKLEDGRNALSDYRYPHEWLTSWYIAAETLKHDSRSMIGLMKEVQSETPYPINFRLAAAKMGKDLNFIAGVLKISDSAMVDMQKIADLSTLNLGIDKKFRE